MRGTFKKGLISLQLVLVLLVSSSAYAAGMRSIREEEDSWILKVIRQCVYVVTDVLGVPDPPK